MATSEQISSVTETGPTPEVLEPEAALEVVLDACHRPASEGLWEALDAGGEAVRAAIREVAAEHAELVASVGITEEPPTDPDARLDALRRYRQGAAGHVLPRLELALEHHRPTLLAAREVGTAFDAARDASSALPFRTEVRWGEGALATLPTDGAARRLRKAVARTVSAARKPGGSRQAPLRAVALHHLEARVAPALADAVVMGVHGWAAWVARLERACADWAGEVLPVLTRLDAPPRTGGDDGEEDSREDEAAREDRPEAGSVRDWEDVRRAVETLSGTLSELLEQVPHEEARERADARLTPAVMELSSDLRAVGSFAHRKPESGVEDPRLVSLDRIRRKFESWDTQAAARLHMYRAFLEILLGSRAVLERLGSRARDAVLESQSDLSVCLAELESLADEVPTRAAGETLAEALTEVRARANEIVARALSLFPEPAEVDRTLDALVSDAVDALQAIVRQSPETMILHRLSESDTETLRPDDTRAVPFRERARQSLDAMRIERIRSAVLGLGTGLGPVRASLAELPDVLAFAFDAARSELDGGARDKPEDDAEETRPEERAIRFATEALDRSAGVVRDVPGRVTTLLERTGARIDAEMMEGSDALLDRLGAGRMQSQLLRAQSRFFELWLRLVDRVGPGVRRVRRFARFRYLRTRRAARKIQRVLRGLVGDVPVSDARAARTIRAFAQADAGAEHVPLVYQRLFSMEPVTDPSFLVGRAAELADVLKRWRRWTEEDEVPLVVRGDPGVGVTSFLDGAAALLEEQGASVVHMDVPDRLLDEGALASLVARTLGVQEEERLADLARRILSTRRDAIPDVVVLDGLEHLYLRVPQGTDLLERLLTLMSETEPRAFWLAGVGRPAWQLMGKMEPTAVSQVDDLQLAPLTPDRLKETILQRHRRSGLRLRFLEPREGRALLRRRARRLRGTEGHQRLLEQDFFEQLHRVSLGNLKLAMFHWLLSADFEAREGEVLVHPLVRPDFAVLEGLADTQNFALKALLEHRSLTLAEYCRIFRVGRQVSYQIFESLQNRRVVEEIAPPPPVTSDGSEMERSSRYRIRPLLVGAVTAHLRKRNIVH